MSKEPTSIRRVLAALMMSLMMGVSAPGLAQEATPPAATADNAAVVDLNTATEAELMTLAGIGPSKAQAIIAHRERRPFRRVEDLMRVRGIGRSTFRRLRSRLVVTR